VSGGEKCVLNQILTLIIETHIFAIYERKVLTFLAVRKSDTNM
jgi:hypothetical protein